MKRLAMILGIYTLLLVSSSHAQWEPDVRLTFDPRQSFNSYNNAWCVAASGDTVHVVWHDERDGNREIYAKRSTDSGVSWGADTRLTYNNADSYFSSVAVSGQNVHVVWIDGRDEFSGEIYYKRSTDSGTSWGTDTRLTNASWYSWYPSVAVSGQNVHVVWQDQRDGNFEIYYKRSTDSGASWGADTRLTNDSLRSEFPSAAVSGQNVHVVWDDYRDGNREIYAKRSTDGGLSWGTDTRLTNNGSFSEYPSAAVSGQNVHVVWHDFRNGNDEIYAKRSTDSGASWGPDTRLTNASYGSCYPSVAVSGQNVHVVWEDYRDVNGEIYAKRSTDSGTSWGSDTRLTNYSSDSERPSVAVSGTNVHVVWYDYRDGNSEIYYKRDPTGNIGVENQKGFEGPRVQGVKATPNPFSSFATLPGHEAERFSVYDVSGRKVGVFRGDRVGEGLAPGVYFLRQEGRNTEPLRIVKVR